MKGIYWELSDVLRLSHTDSLTKCATDWLEFVGNNRALTVACATAIADELFRRGIQTSLKRNVAHD